ncbi:MAG: M56 family metallopeptidase [Thermoguttaceae bacterium]
MMSTYAFLAILLRTTLILTVAGMIGELFSLRLKNRFPELRQYSWMFVLLLGCTFFQFQLSIPTETVIPIQPVSVRQMQSAQQSSPTIGLTEMSEQSDFRSLKSPLMKTERDRAIGTEGEETAGSFQQGEKGAIGEKQAGETVEYDWGTVLIVLWISGMTFCVFSATLKYVRFLRLLHDTIPASEPDAEFWNQLLIEHGIPTGSIPMLFSPTVGPALVRTFRGYHLVIPRTLWSELPESGKRGILRHELTHYLRHDVWKSFAVRLLGLPHWFNPMSHLAFHRFDEATEQLCDRSAFSEQEGGITEFAQILLLLHENAPTQFIARHSIFGSSLKNRVACLLQSQPLRKVSLMKKTALTLTAILLLGLALFRWEFVPYSRADVLPDSSVAEQSTLDLSAPTPPPTTAQNELSAPQAPEIAVSPVNETQQITGTVVDEKQEPVPGTKVWIMTRNGMGERFIGEKPFVTDAEGKFTFEINEKLLQEGLSYSFEFVGPDGTKMGGRQWDSAKKNGCFEEPILALSNNRPVRLITGTVVDASDKPIQGAWVGGRSGNNGGQDCAMFGETDEKGHFQFSFSNSYHWAENLAHIYAIKPGVGMTVLKTGENDSPQEEKRDDSQPLFNGPFHLKLDESQTVTVRVVDEEGNPLAGCRVMSSINRDGPEGGFALTGDSNGFRPAELIPTTNATGEVQLNWIPKNHLARLGVCVSGPVERITLPDGTQRRFGATNEKFWNGKDAVMTVVLPQAGQVRLKIVDEEGKPYAASFVVNWKCENRPLCGMCYGLDDQIGKGEYLLVGNVGDRYSIQIMGWSAPDLVFPVQFGTIPGQSGKAPKEEVRTVVAKRGTKVFGTLLGPDGKPITEGDRYWLTGNFAGPENQVPEMTRFGINIRHSNQYEVWLAPGRYEFKVELDWQIRQKMQPGEEVLKATSPIITVKGDEEEIRLDLQLKPGKIEEQGRE